MFKFVWLGGLVFLLSGCAFLAIPPAVTIASYAADGISYIFTGKSVTDHALSSLAGEDCAMWRMIRLENPCQPREDEAEIVLAEGREGREENPDVESQAGTGTQVAAQATVWTNPYDEPEEYLSAARLRPRAREDTAERLSRIAPAAGGGTPQPLDTGTPQPLDTGTPPPSDAGRATALAEIPPSPTPTNEPVARIVPPPAATTAPSSPLPRTVPRVVPRTEITVAPSPIGKKEVFLVIGSFRERAAARREARRHAAHHSTVVPARVRGRRYYRVVARSAPGKQLSETRRALARAGIIDAWPILPCRKGVAGPRCLALDKMPMLSATPAEGGGGQVSERSSAPFAAAYRAAVGG